MCSFCVDIGFQLLWVFKVILWAVTGSYGKSMFTFVEKKESEVAPMDYSLPGFSVHGIFRQESWSGLPFPSPGDRPDRGIEPRSPVLQADALPSEPHQGSPKKPSNCLLQWLYHFTSQQCIRVPIAPYSHQYFVLSMF